MNTMVRAVTAIGLLALGACAAPAISDIAADKVKVQSDTDNLEVATSEAVRGCALYKRHPVYLSKRIIPTSGWTAKVEYLFACMAPGHANVQLSS
jgi:hypothetical protein